MQILSGKLTDKQEFIGALNRILNYSRRGKHRRLWRLAVATQPPIAETPISSRVPRGHVSIRNPLQAPKERSLQWVSLYRSRSAEPLQNRYFCDIIHLLCCLTSFDTHINIVRYTHPHRSIHAFISNDVR